MMTLSNNPKTFYENSRFMNLLSVKARNLDVTSDSKALLHENSEKLFVAYIMYHGYCYMP